MPLPSSRNVLLYLPHVRVGFKIIAHLSLFACLVDTPNHRLGNISMKIATSFAAALALAQSASAHYIFQQLTVGSTKYPVFQYIRQNSNYNSPVTGMKPVLAMEPCSRWRKNPRRCSDHIWAT